MSFPRRPFWQYPLFQIPLIFLGGFLLLALLFGLLRWGRPNVAVAIALDLSPSTHEPQPFNAPGTVMDRELAAVRAYLQQNTQQLKTPNQVQIFGFANATIPLTSTFEIDSQTINPQLNQALQKLQDDRFRQQRIGQGTDLNTAIQQGTNLLATTQKLCRELLLVTDGQALVSNTVIQQARNQNVRINAVVVGSEAPQLRLATILSGGLYQSDTAANLQALFTEQFFTRFNNNYRWVIFWLACAWVAFMWLLTMPLDRYLFQGLFRLEMPLAGKLALGNALFWTAATPGILWHIYRLLNLAAPFLGSC